MNFAEDVNNNIYFPGYFKTKHLQKLVLVLLIVFVVVVFSSNTKLWTWTVMNGSKEGFSLFNRSCFV